MLKKFIAKKFKTLRKENNLSLKELSIKMEKPYCYLSKIETGIIYPTIKDIEKFCEIINISISLFFDF